MLDIALFFKKMKGIIETSKMQSHQINTKLMWF